jgi:pimeloyl-[acyl-carrier protein] methyl ester esterase
MTLRVDSAGAGAPMVLLHGWGFHSAVWNGFADELARRHHVHLVDLPGHGHSQEATLGSLDETVDQVAEVVPDGALVVGWSLGGLVAQGLARRYPRSVRALALVSTTPCFVRRVGWAHAMATETLDDFGAGLRDHPHETLERFVRLNTFNVEAARPAIRALSRGLRERPMASSGALEAGLAMLRETDLRAESVQLQMPTIVIHGARDRIVPVDAGRWLARETPGATLVELEASAHLPFVTDRQAVVRAVETLRD